MSDTPTRTPAKVNYLNNRDILKEIHLSKNTYCWYADRANDHQYDIILPSLSKINQRTIAEARRNRADRIKRETGEVLDPTKIPNTDIVFRITCWDHIPAAPKKVPKTQAKKKKIEEKMLKDSKIESPVATGKKSPVINDIMNKDDQKKFKERMEVKKEESLPAANTQIVKKLKEKKDRYERLHQL